MTEKEREREKKTIYSTPKIIQDEKSRIFIIVYNNPTSC